ncbi:MAG: bifunctional pantoate--beta-alanine ligase/(d)CMP kinase [Spirulinaceae cyanobacterium]
MRILNTIAGLNTYKKTLPPGKKIALVATMGALHPGHTSLIKLAREDGELVIVSIFINPLQFSPTEDLQRYPQTFDADCQLCEQLGVDVVFAPTPTAMGLEQLKNPKSHSQMTMVVPPAEMISVLCGLSRAKHFQGVATIVTKLLNIVEPTVAFFGQKDAQQLAIIKRLVKDLNLSVEIKSCPIIREESGLAYSSRNTYLTPTQQQKAAILYRSLEKAQQAFLQGENSRDQLLSLVTEQINSVPEVAIEYVELVDPITLETLGKIVETGLLAIAAKVGNTRLIDNIQLRQPQPVIAIDGPAGAGKSTVARLVANKLGFLFLDTGAMYRAVTWSVLQRGIDVNDEVGIAELVSQSVIKLTPADRPEDPIKVEIDSQDVTHSIRQPHITANVSTIAAQPAVRQELLKQQQEWGKQGRIVAEGRDIGTHVFPNAELKIFLTASVRQRALRRQQDLQNQGQTNVSLEELEQAIQKRDHQDANRRVAPLRKAPGAVEINTDNLSIREVTQSIISLTKY